jgi:hypothetical protein
MINILIRRAIRVKDVKQIFQELNIPADTTEQSVKSALESVLAPWLETGSANYKLAIELGTTIEKISKYLPEKLKKSPSNTLYRFVEISTSLIEKVERNEKQAILRNRKYSSWSYSLEAVKKFGDMIGSHVSQYTGVILKRTFSDNQILLNVPECLKLLPNLDDTSEWEKEIIVKNALKDFKFTASDIHLVQRYNIPKPHTWKELKRKLDESKKTL